MDLQQKVLWNEGLFLMPHHFQQWDRHLEAELWRRLRAIQPICYDFTELMIDEDALAVGDMVVNRCAGVMQDRLPFSAPDADWGPPTRQLSGIFDSKGAIFDARRGGIGAYLAAPPSEDYRRARVAGKVVRDAMFSGNGDEPTLTFTDELFQRIGVYQATVAIDKEQLDPQENSEGRRAFACTLDDPIACRVAIQVTKGKWIEARSERRPRALLRGAAGAALLVDAASRVVLTWNLVEAVAPPAKKKETVGYFCGAPSEEADKAATPAATPDEKKSWLIQLVVDGGPALALFFRRAFDELAFPATIAVRPQEQ